MASGLLFIFILIRVLHFASVGLFQPHRSGSDILTLKTGLDLVLPLPLGLIPLLLKHGLISQQFFNILGPVFDNLKFVVKLLNLLVKPSLEVLGVDVLKFLNSAYIILQIQSKGAPTIFEKVDRYSQKFLGLPHNCSLVFEILHFYHNEISNLSISLTRSGYLRQFLIDLNLRSITL